MSQLAFAWICKEKYGSIHEASRAIYSLFVSKCSAHPRPRPVGAIQTLSLVVFIESARDINCFVVQIMYIPQQNYKFIRVSYLDHNLWPSRCDKRFECPLLRENMCKFFLCYWLRHYQRSEMRGNALVRSKKLFFSFNTLAEKNLQGSTKKYKISYKEPQKKTSRIYGILHELNNCYKNLHENARIGTLL